MRQQAKLTNLQLELLKYFQYDLNETQLLEIKQLLTRYFAERATKQMDKMWDEKGWSNETMEKWLNEHNRISGKP